MTINVIYERDDRNVKAWAYDPLLISEYAQKIKFLDDNLEEVGLEEAKREKVKLRDELDINLSGIGRQRQQRLYDSKVLVVGSDALAQMILSCLVGIGVGNIFFMDNKRINSKDRNDFLCTNSLFHLWQKKVRHIDGALREINSQSNITSRHAKFTEAFVYNFNPEIIIEATNDPNSKAAVIDYALGERSYSIPIISASSNNHMGVLACYWPIRERLRIRDEEPDLEVLLHKEFEGSLQGSFSSGFIAGLVTEEYRKFKFKYTEDGNDANLENNQRLVYNPYSNTRHGFECHLKQDRLGYFRDKKALVAGAGALGNFVALELALMGVGRIDIIDSDYAEDTNLSRQILLRGRIGDKKAKIVAERLKEIDSSIDARWRYAKFGESSILPSDLKQRYEDHLILSYHEGCRGVEQVREQQLVDNGYDIIFGCFDNKYARIWLNAFSVKHKVPYIDGGTGAQSGQVAIYIPGKTMCVDCQLNLNSFPERNSCQIDPSTIIPNIIIASEMVAESINVFNPRLNKEPIQGIFQYMPSEPLRYYLSRRRAVSANEHGC